MLLHSKLLNTIFNKNLCALFLFFGFCLNGMAKAHSVNTFLVRDTVVNPEDLHYPLSDRMGDSLSSIVYNSFDYFNPSNQKDSIVFDLKKGVLFVVNFIKSKNNVQSHFFEILD